MISFSRFEYRGFLQPELILGKVGHGWPIRLTANVRSAPLGEILSGIKPCERSQGDDALFVTCLQRAFV